MDWLLEEVELWLLLNGNGHRLGGVVSEEGLEWILELDLLWLLWHHWGCLWDFHSLVDGSLWLWVWEERAKEVEALVLLVMLWLTEQ